MIIAIGSDHAGFKLKEKIKNSFQLGNKFIDVGAFSEESVDYPDIAHLAVKIFFLKKADKIIVICGSGNGIQMAVNKHKGIRCALCWNKEMAELSRQHNDANAISLPARFITKSEAVAIIEKFLKTPFEGGRHLKRTKKIDA